MRCLIAAPSFVATNIGNATRSEDGLQRPGSASDGIDYMTPDAAAQAILEGAEKDRAFIPVGRVAWLSALIMRASPAVYERMMRRRISGETAPK